MLQQLAQTFGGVGRTALGFDPTYSMHVLIARSTGTGWISGPRTAGFAIDADVAAAVIAERRPHIVFLASPNNPTGTALSDSTVQAIHDAAQAARVDTGGALVVVDEAYAEFSHRPSALPLLDGRPNLVITRTMSKACGVAGLRLGYLAAHPAVVAAVQLVRLPYHLSALTQAAALAIRRWIDRRDR